MQKMQFNAAFKTDLRIHEIQFVAFLYQGKFAFFEITPINNDSTKM